MSFFELHTKKASAFEIYPDAFEWVVDVEFDEELRDLIPLIHSFVTEITDFDLGGVQNGQIRFLVISDDIEEEIDDIEWEIERAVKNALIKNLKIYHKYYTAFEKYLKEQGSNLYFDKGGINDASHEFEEGYEDYSIAELMTVTDEEVDEDIKQSLEEVSL